VYAYAALNFQQSSWRHIIFSPSVPNSPAPPPQNSSAAQTIAPRDFFTIGTTRAYESHAVVIREGFPAGHLLILCSGRVKLTAASSEGRTLLLRVATPGDFLGLAALLQNALYGVTAEALGPCIIKSIPRADFLRFMTKYPDTGHSIVQALAREYNGAVLTARRLALYTSAAGKLASTLLDMARSCGVDSNATLTHLPVSFLMELTHEDLGSMAGISRETVSRLLTRFRRDGHVHQLHDRMTLSHPVQMEARYC
jgi:CRP/FNR family cyclic AMP-dependent transcriptional regulator